MTEDKRKQQKRAMDALREILGKTYHFILLVMLTVALDDDTLETGNVVLSCATATTLY